MTIKLALLIGYGIGMIMGIIMTRFYIKSMIQSKAAQVVKQPSMKYDDITSVIDLTIIQMIYDTTWQNRVTNKREILDYEEDLGRLGVLAMSYISPRIRQEFYFYNTEDYLIMYIKVRLKDVILQYMKDVQAEKKNIMG